MLRPILLCVCALMIASCGNSPTAVVDYYDMPADVVIIPGNRSLTVRFISMPQVIDFLGFNVYIGITSNQGSVTRIPDSTGAVPTFNYKDKVTTNSVISLTITNDAASNALVNGTTYYIAVTAYGTNAYKDVEGGGKIETPRGTLFRGTPREEGDIVISNQFMYTADNGIAYSSGTGKCVLTNENVIVASVASAFYTKITNYAGTPSVAQASSGALSGFAIQCMGYRDDLASCPIPASGFLAAGSSFPLAQGQIYALNNGTVTIMLRVTSVVENAGSLVSSIHWAVIP
ncbi:MAG: hypothetical protein HZC28_02530 [Spirochaetes bacterium]|nr:hypothetical protein [Spirochaetota bacterium]